MLPKLRRPDDWLYLQDRAWWVSWINPRRAKAMRRLAKRWGREDFIEWVCT